MKTLISCIALFGVSIGLSSSAFAQNYPVCEVYSLSTNEYLGSLYSFNACANKNIQCLQSSTCYILWL